MGRAQRTFSCFHLDPTDRFAEVEGWYLVVANIRQALQLECARTKEVLPGASTSMMEPTKVLVRATEQDFETILRRSATVRVIQAFARYEEGMVVLDATSPPTFFAAAIPVRQDECVEVAEVFAGGFGGWHRAVSVLRHSNVQAHTSWRVEQDPECAKAFGCSQP